MIVIAVYFPVLEGLKGYTVGKKLLRIRVVDQHGNLPGIPKAIVRSLLRIIETNPVFLGGVPAGIIALVSKKKQRLGDMLAKTYVVKTQDITTEIPSN